MTAEKLKTLHKTVKETALFGRYITNAMIAPLLKKYDNAFKLQTIGNSVEGKSIYSITIGKGSTKVLLWSQMHGNESTTTKALFDLFKFLATDHEYSKAILDNLTLCAIPILNPDGAERYTRLNANEVDLNRDAQALSQPESKALRDCFDSLQPDLCFNLHGQRTIFGVNQQSAILSFLAPAQDEQRTVTANRKQAMALISGINNMLQEDIPGCVGLYDDSFNLDCVGDTFQNLGVPTILFEAGHYPNDYYREETRRLVFMSFLKSFQIISNHEFPNYKAYFNIPQNQKCFYDIIIRNAKLTEDDDSLTSIAVQYKEVLVDDDIQLKPVIENISALDNFCGHREIDARSKMVKGNVNKTLNVGSEIDFVFINDEKILLKSQ